MSVSRGYGSRHRTCESNSQQVVEARASSPSFASSSVRLDRVLRLEREPELHARRDPPPEGGDCSWSSQTHARRRGTLPPRPRSTYRDEHRGHRRLAHARRGPVGCDRRRGRVRAPRRGPPRLDGPGGLRHLRRRRDRDDAVQSAWTIAWRRMGRCAIRSASEPGSSRSPRTRLARACAPAPPRARRRHLGRASRATEGDDPDRRDRGGGPRRAMRGLTAEERSLLAMRYAAGLDSTEIGRQLGHLRVGRSEPPCPDPRAPAHRPRIPAETDR